MRRFPFMMVLAAIGVAATPFAALAQHEDHKHPPAQQPSNQPSTHGGDPHAAGETKSSRPSDPYPLSTCPVSGEKLGEMGDPVVKTYEGREVRFCCSGCIEKFESAKTDYWKKIDDAIVKDQTTFYPLTTCVISGEPLVEDGKDIAVNYIYNNRLIRFCCSGCVKDFRKAPEAALKKLDAAAIQQQRLHYPMTSCPVSGEKLGSMGDPYEVVIANHLVRLCCKSCEKDLRAKPAEFLAKLDEAWKRQGMPHPTDKAPSAAHEGETAPQTPKDDKHGHDKK